MSIKLVDNKMAIPPFKRNFNDPFENKTQLKRPSTPPPYLLGKRPAF